MFIRQIALVARDLEPAVEHLCAVLGLDNSNYWRIGQNTCAINVFEWQKGVFFIHSLNDTCHLKAIVA